MAETAYIASDFGLVDRVRGVCRMVERHGYEVPDRWWEHRDHKRAPVPLDEWYSLPAVRQTYLRHLDTIDSADVFVLVCPPPESDPIKYNGANVELGYALASGAACYAVGSLGRSAMYAGVGWAERFHELEDALMERSHG